MKEQDLNKDNLPPVHMVSVDHYITQYLCRIYHTKVKLDPYEMFSGGYFFIDHISGYVSIKHQVDIKTTETAKSRLTLERETQSHGVVIKLNHTDNGIFNAS